ncbi:MAG: hypothetical protein KJZ78_20840 [Bryobacteraceae bacterium]|nr:hypothetical protein [Bryobacteraceae bacterium]
MSNLVEPLHVLIVFCDKLAPQSNLDQVSRHQSHQVNRNRLPGQYPAKLHIDIGKEIPKDSVLLRVGGEFGRLQNRSDNTPEPSYNILQALNRLRRLYFKVQHCQKSSIIGRALGRKTPVVDILTDGGLRQRGFETDVWAFAGNMRVISYSPVSSENLVPSERIVIAPE